MRKIILALIGAVVALGFGMAQAAELGDKKTLTMAEAKKIMAAAEAEAIKNKWTVAIAIVDEAGDLLMFTKLDDTQVGSVDIAIGKAYTSARLKRPTKLLEDAVIKGGRTVLLSVKGLTLLEGGVPIIVGGKVIGAVGVSGVMSNQDAQVAQAGVDVVK